MIKTHMQTKLWEEIPLQSECNHVVIMKEALHLVTERGGWDGWRAHNLWG